MNRRIANKILRRHEWFETDQYAVGDFSKRKGSSRLESDLVLRAIRALKLKISFPEDGGGFIFKVDNADRMKHPNEPRIPYEEHARRLLMEAEKTHPDADVVSVRF